MYASLILEWRWWCHQQHLVTIPLLPSHTHTTHLFQFSLMNERHTPFSYLYNYKTIFKTTTTTIHENGEVQRHVWVWTLLHFYARHGFQTGLGGWGSLSHTEDSKSLYLYNKDSKTCFTNTGSASTVEKGCPARKHIFSIHRWRLKRREGMFNKSPFDIKTFGGTILCSNEPTLQSGCSSPFACISKVDVKEVT